MAMITVYKTSAQRAVQPIKGVKLSGGTTIVQYVSDTNAAVNWIAKQRSPSLYHFA